MIIAGYRPSTLAYCCGLCLLAAATSLPAAEVSGDDDSGELLLFGELPMVISASRQETPIRLAPAPVSVIDADEIARGLYPTLEESFFFTVGMHAQTIDRNRFAIGVRGLHEAFSERTLTLIDGRPADSPVFGGSEFPRRPLLLEDIDRIEIVRGPGGAAWGPNAFSGVINIIPKRPADMERWMGSATLSHLGDGYARLRHADVRGPWSYRISSGFSYRNDSDDAMDEDFDARDWRRSWVVDGEAALDLGDESLLRFGIGGSRMEHGSSEFLLEDPDEEVLSETLRSFAVLDHRLASGDRLELQWSGNWLRTNNAGISHYSAFENQLDLKTSMRPMGDHKVILGGNIRHVLIEDEDADSTLAVGDGSEDEYLLGIYALDRWLLRPDLILDAQLRVDYYSETDADVSGRLAALYSLDPQDKQVVRVAGATAVRTPAISLRDVEGEFAFVAPATPLFRILPPRGELDNERTWSAELGYSIRPREKLLFRIDTYYQRFEDLIGFVSEAVGPTTEFRASNIDGADSWGGEVQLSWTEDAWQASLWYALNAFERDQTPQDIRAYDPAEQSVGGMLRWRARRWAVLNLAYRYSDVTRGSDGSSEIDDWHRLDLVLSGELPVDGLSYGIGVHDIFDETDLVVPGLADTDPHPTPGRSVLGRMTWTW